MARLICGEKGSVLFCDSGETTVSKSREEKKQTNADRIRAMSDEELSKILDCQFIMELTHSLDWCTTHKCKECKLLWLQSEVEEEHEDM